MKGEFTDENIVKTAEGQIGKLLDGYKNDVDLNLVGTWLTDNNCEEVVNSQKHFRIFTMRRFQQKIGMVKRFCCLKLNSCDKMFSMLID